MKTPCKSKRTFSDEKDARANTPDGHTFYCCNHCGLWHLTTKGKKKNTARYWAYKRKTRRR